MNDGRDLLKGVLADALPDAHDITAGGVNDPAPVPADLLDERHRRPECGYDHDVVGTKVLDMGASGVVEKVPDTEGGDLRVDLRVVDDLTDQEKSGVGENLPGRIGEVDGAFDPVAEAELLCQPDDRVSGNEDGSRGTDALD